MFDGSPQALKHHGLLGSMSRVRVTGDNAAMESFYATLQKNVLDRRRWSTRNELRLASIHWIERTYHRRRRGFDDREEARGVGAFRPVVQVAQVMNRQATF